jgi:hypothetical protein
MTRLLATAAQHSRADAVRSLPIPARERWPDIKAQAEQFGKRLKTVIRRQAAPYPALKSYRMNDAPQSPKRTPGRDRVRWIAVPKPAARFMRSEAKAHYHQLQMTIAYKVTAAWGHQPLVFQAAPALWWLKEI